MSTAATYSPNSDTFPSPDIDAYFTESSYPGLSDYSASQNYAAGNDTCFNGAVKQPADGLLSWSAPVHNTSFISAPPVVSAVTGAAKPPLTTWSNNLPTPLSVAGDFQNGYMATDFNSNFPSLPSPLPTPSSHGSPTAQSPVSAPNTQPTPEDTTTVKPPPRKRGRPRLNRPASDPTASNHASKGSKTQCMPHTEVERKYREKLNAELERLRRAVPMLPQCDTADSSAVKPSKSMILAVAIDYIKELERQRDVAVEEVERLGGKVQFTRPGAWKREASES
ncbi:transcription factor bhlh [Pyrenophora seminiperda CCB06]|uniref:Transcription factor bhlh n=1 Tax=Pyrenophora seminiperda CCB06 TaxID=1302712 RepID=A0A3M7M4N5_9PLEO|nr:transcription factor bhlh [Pyrenophora seminiperda CCB06]